MRSGFAAIVATGLLVGCGGEPQSVHQGSDSGMEVNRRGAVVSGTAGSGWTDAELQEGLNSGTVCNNAQQVRNLEITRDATGAISFTGICG